MYDQVELQRPPTRTADRKVSYGQPIKMATLNVSTLWKPTMHNQIEDYMAQRGVSLLCMQETKVSHTTQYVVGDLLYVVHGHGTDAFEHAGVGMVFRKDLRRHITGFELGNDGRILMVGLDLAPRRLTVISAYAPHSLRPEEERVAFMEELTAAVERSQKKGITLVLGDLNARLHGRLRGEDTVLGPNLYGWGAQYVIEALRDRERRHNTEKTNRELLMEMCMTQGLRVANTWFRKPQHRKVTYRSPGVSKLPKGGENWDPAVFAELDLCLIPNRWKGAVEDVQSITWAGLNSDHFPLEVLVKAKLGRRPQSGNGGATTRYDFTTIDDEARAALDEGVSALETRVTASETIGGAWEVLKNGALQAMEANVPHKPMKARRAWITADTFELLEHRRALAAEGLVADARAIDKMIRASAKEDKRAWIEKGLAEKFWEPIKEATRKPQTRPVALKDTLESGPAASSRKPADVYARHLAEVQWGAGPREPAETIGWGTSQIGGEAVGGVNTELFSMEELDAALKGTKRGKAPGPDQIPAELWKELDQGRGALLSFFNKCWAEASFPDQWRESTVVGIFKKGRADDPANYRPISLLGTAYKLFSKMVANRLLEGLEDRLRSTQYGFRRGRSTTEPMFILRRMQDLVHAKKNRALHLVFLDWSKAFDKVDTRCLPTVLRRFGVPEKMIQVIEALVESPTFRVSMQGETSGAAGQETGIRQGCTLSPFLFTLILSAIMQDVETRVRGEHPMATTPAFPVMDLEYADDTVLIAVTTEIAQKLLQYTEEEASKYGLHLNRGKTVRLAYNTDEIVKFADGTPVPRSTHVEYLGTIMNDWGHSDAEVASRLKKAQGKCKALKPIWASRALDRGLAIRVLRSCVFSGLLYGLHTVYLTQGLSRRIDAFQIKCLRRALGIRPTYASKLLGEEAVLNQEVACLTKATPLSADLTKMRYQLLGHVLRRGGNDPLRATTYDRFGQPKTLAGTARWGGRRKGWAEEVLNEAMSELKAQGHLVPPRGGGPVGHDCARTATLAQDRVVWREWTQTWYKGRSWRDFAITSDRPPREA